MCGGQNSSYLLKGKAISEQLDTGKRCREGGKWVSKSKEMWPKKKNPVLLKSWQDGYNVLSLLL